MNELGKCSLCLNRLWTESLCPPNSYTGALMPPSVATFGDGPLKEIREVDRNPEDGALIQ